MKDLWHSKPPPWHRCLECQKSERKSHCKPRVVKPCETVSFKSNSSLQTTQVLASIAIAVPIYAYSYPTKFEG